MAPAVDREGWLELRLRASAGSKGCKPDRDDQPGMDTAHPLILSLFAIVPRSGFHKEPLQSFDACRRHHRSDSASGGNVFNVSGGVVAELLRANAFLVISHLAVPDEQAEIEDALRQQCEVASLVVTTGGPASRPAM